MDPTTQTNVVATNNDSSTTNQTTTPPPSNTNTVIAGAFGWTLPVPTEKSETMPAFSFDEDDFWSNTNPTTTQETISDPFAGWVNSLTQTTTPPPSTEVIENIEQQEIKSLDNIIDWNISSWDTSNFQETVFLDTLNDIPQNTQDIMESSPEAIINENINNESQQSEENISFDLPVEPQIDSNTTSFDIPVSPTEETIDTSFDLPMKEPSNTIWWEEVSLDISTESNSISNNNIENKAPETITEDQQNQEETWNISIETIEHNNLSSEQNNDSSLPATVNESRDDSTHELQEIYGEFKKAFNTYTTFKNSDSITLTGLRTDEEEINYTFTQSEDKYISITKSNTSDNLSFQETESGLKTYINEDEIGYYGIDNVDSDTTHYLKEKLGKFTMMLESEYEREEKKLREWAKKIKDTLKNF